MASTVKSRPTYYEMLGLTPAAAGEAIADAFARESSAFRPHAFGVMAELCLAYETLRDPSKRKAYDKSIGLIRDPLPSPAVKGWSFSASMSPIPVAQPPVADRAPPAPQAADRPLPTPQPDPAPPVQRTEPAPPQPALELGEWDSRRSYDGRTGIDISPTEWKRTGMVIGGLVAAAILVGALAGWWSSSDAAEPVVPKRTLPRAKAEDPAPPSFAELWTDPSPAPAATRPTPAIRPKAQRASRRLAEADPAPSEFGSQPVEADKSAADPLSPEATVPVTAASMPLPHRTVARTIDRIGYRCGSVAAATPVEGALGVYNVTCTSGQSFQAKPVNGRYRFRRLN